MFRHTIDPLASRKGYIDALAASVLMATSMLPLLTIAVMILK
jgi:hypothetical protein